MPARACAWTFLIGLAAGCTGGGDDTSSSSSSSSSSSGAETCSFDGRTYQKGEVFVSRVNGACLECVGGTDVFRSSTECTDGGS